MTCPGPAAGENSVSVIVPALNDARQLPETIETVLAAAGAHFDACEIIIINDGSTDDTGEVAERLASEHDNITVVHHDRPHCLGGAYKKGLALARNHHVVLVNGKCDITPGQLGRIFALRGQADMIVPYTVNHFDRHVVRQVISRMFTMMVNVLFGLNLKYYNHQVLHRRSLVGSIEIRTDSYAFQAETLVKLLRMGHSFVHVGVWDEFDARVGTKAFRPQNLYGVARFFIEMILDVYFGRSYRRG